MFEVKEVASGLQFPEGPVVMPDGSVAVVEIHRQTLSRVTMDGEISVIAEVGGGPNGAALGPDGAVYVANNGGFVWGDYDGKVVPFDRVAQTNEPPDFKGGWIDRVEPQTGAHTVLYRTCEGEPFAGPNDIVFDAAGGFWFTDFGKMRKRTVDRGHLFYATVDGDHIVKVPVPMYGPNGVGLSPDGGRVYVGESYTGRLLAWDLLGPGQVASPMPEVVVATKGHFDSMAVEEGGNVVIGAISGGLCIVDLVAATAEYVPFDDPFTTNVAFGGPDRRTAYVTANGSGALLAVEWPRPGLALAF